MTLDEILEKHLPDAGLCNSGKRKNKERKKALKQDLVKLLEGKTIKPRTAIVDTGLIIVDESMLNV